MIVNQMVQSRKVELEVKIEVAYHASNERVMDFDSILSLKEKNNGNANNNGWPKF